MERLATDPLYFAKPDRALFQDIRRYFPITVQAQVAWAVHRASRRRSPSSRSRSRPARSTAASPAAGDDAQGQAVPAHALPERDYCPSHQHLEQRRR